MTELLSK